MKTDMELNSKEEQARRLERVGTQLADLLRQPGMAERLNALPGEDEWSVMQVLGHLVEMIPYWLDKCRQIIAATGHPPEFGRKLDASERLAGVEQGTNARLEELLPRLEKEIEVGAQAIRGMSPAERSKTGLHIRDGEITVAEVIERIIVDHAEEHLAQVHAILKE